MFSRLTYSRLLTKPRVQIQWKACKYSNTSYVQGQLFDNRIREYFYYIDHQGMLFLDDARMKNFTSCFKDKTFLAFFFKRIKKNTTGRYVDFPYVSLCGLERNYVRCDDLPIVFTKVLQVKNLESNVDEDWFSYAHADNLLMVPFQPEKIFMNIQSGRVYHPAPEKGGGIGLVRSSLAIEFSKFFSFDDGEEHGPTHFIWRNKKHELNIEWHKGIELKNNFSN